MHLLHLTTSSVSVAVELPSVRREIESCCSQHVDFLGDMMIILSVSRLHLVPDPGIGIGVLFANMLVVHPYKIFCLTWKLTGSRLA